MARIRVKNKQTGQTGTMPEDRFDPSVFDKIGVESTPAATPITPTATPTVGGGLDINQPFKQEEPKKQGFIGKVFDALSIPSFAIGGVAKRAREEASGEREPATLKERLPSLIGGPLFTPGVFEGIKEKTPLIEEAPKLVGVDPNSLPGLAIGFAAEIATPDPLDFVAASKLGTKLTGKVSEAVGKFTKARASKIGIKSASINPSQFRKFKKKVGQNIGDFIVEKNLFGKGTEAVGKAIDELQKPFDEIVENSGRFVKVDDLDKSFTKKVDELLSKPAQALKNKGNAVKEYADNLINPLREKGVTEIGVFDMTTQRREVDDLVKTFKFDDVQKSQYQQVREILQDSIREAVDDIKFKGQTLKEMGSDLRELRIFEEIAEMQEGVGAGRKLIGFSDVGVAIAGGAFGGGETWEERIFRGLTAGAAFKLLNHPKVVGGLAKMFSKFGPAAVTGAAKVAKTGAIVAGRGEPEEPTTPGLTFQGGQPAVPGAQAPTEGLGEPSAAIQQKQKTATGHTLDEHSQALSQATAANNRPAMAQIAAQMEIEKNFQERRGGVEDDLDPKTKQLARSGNSAMDDVIRILDVKDGKIGNKDIGSKQIVPGQFLDRELDAAAFRAVDALLRIRSGAATPEKEVRRFMAKFFGTIVDDETVVVSKIQDMQAEFKDITGESLRFQGGGQVGI